jgi:predicted DNA-binding protein (MmcQ/YjbR family)
MGPAELRVLCLAFSGSVETFALSRLAETPLRVSLKCEPQLAAQLRQAHRAVLPGYHLNKRHWNTVIIDGSMPERMIKDMVEDSYDLVVSHLPVSRRWALGWRPDER